eukprot:TRINITY_DN598_c0_g2_i1.p1 TRINITY_DN598_c0_g2~~TRINITY_DN598_c0_g2_i1.p1  ORF type:complete len:450 (+),score=78.39 TRINITY_DN598_c0_g2_i1:304-1653(+)
MLREYKVVNKTQTRPFFLFLQRCFNDGGLFSDIAFVIHQLPPLRLHKCILASRSSYFYKMIATKWKHKNEVRFTNSQINPTAFISILRYLYTDRLELPSYLVPECVMICKSIGLIGLYVSLQSEKDKRSDLEVVVIESADIGNPEQLEEEELLSDGKSSLFAQTTEKSNLLQIQKDFSKLYSSFVTEAKERPMEEKITEANYYADASFEVEGQIFPCHRVFFSGRSDYFNVLLAGKFKEGAMTNSSSPIHIAEMKKETFSIVARYIYTDVLVDSDLKDSNSLFEVFQAADLFLLAGLKSLAVTLLNQFIDTSNVFDLIEVSRVYNLSRLEEECIAFIADHLEEVIEREEFITLVKESAFSITGRQETDSVPVVDEIRTQIWKYKLTDGNHIALLSTKSGKPASSSRKRTDEDQDEDLSLLDDSELAKYKEKQRKLLLLENLLDKLDIHG